VVDVLVILDGASEPLRGDAPTSLEAARTPALDALAAEGRVAPLATVGAGLPVGSESAIPGLLGWTPPEAVDRGAVEAAAYGIEVGFGERAWRVDVVSEGGERADAAATSCAAAALGAGAAGHRVVRLAGHRLLLVGPPPLPAAARSAGLHVWPEGVVPPRLLGSQMVVVGARGAAIGVARLMGAATVVPAGATGQPDSDLSAKAASALDALAAGAERVVVHVGGADEAAHARDRAAKVAVIERADRELIAPLAAALRRDGGTLRVCPDHGCDPATGLHDGTPVPCLDWTAEAEERESVPHIGGQINGPRLTERAVALVVAA